MILQFTNTETFTERIVTLNDSQGTFTDVRK